MVTKELLRAIRNDLPMKLTIIRLGRFGPIAKQSDGYFRFQCPHCSELRATVNPSNNLAHCFCCGKNFNNIDLCCFIGMTSFLQSAFYRTCYASTDATRGVRRMEWNGQLAYIPL